MSSLLDRLDNIDSHVFDGNISPDSLYKRLTNKSSGIVFFTGAGFSKAWNHDYPLGAGLFSIKNIVKLKTQYNFFKVAKDLAITEPIKSSKTYDQDCYNYCKEIKFHLDIFRRYPSLMPVFLDPTLIAALEAEMRLFIKERFAEIVGQQELTLSAKKDESHPFIPLFKDLLTKHI